MISDFKNLSHILWGDTNRSTMHQNFNFFLPQARAFENKIEKEPQKPHPKLNQYVYYI